jgi:AsmA-like C-terminal region/AsmA family
MKKTLKWTLMVVGGLIVVLLAAAFILPVIFKDDIKAAIDKEIAKSVNADVVFEDFNISLFKNFPNLTASMADLGVINREPFAGQILFATEKFQVEVNLMDVLFGDNLSIKGISLIEPIINVKVNKDGKANYDIAVPSSDTTTAEEGGEFSFKIDHWEIVDGDVSYDDQTLPYNLTITGLNHSGSGDFNEKEFDLTTHTIADSVTTSFDGTEYLTDKRAEIDAVINISEDYSRYTFKENKAKINDFAMSFDGWLKMNENDFEMDINYKSPENTFQSLLSIVPGMYSKDFEKIDTKGDLSFSGFVKGKYSEKQMPAFNLNLLVKDAMFKYPDLPTAVDNINMDLLVDNKDGVIDNTVIDLKKLHLDFGKNPVDARALISKIYPTNVDAEVKGKLNLAELNQMFPMEGLTMKGNFSLDVKAKGIYDSLKKLIPAVDANMALANGYVKSSDFPIPMEDMKFTSNVRNSTGKMEETVINVSDFSMLMDGEKLAATLLLQNLNDYTWDMKLNGGIDLEKITKVFPLDGMSLAGKVKADIATKGKYSDLQAERYDKLPTSGTASLKDFKYITKDLPEVTLSQAAMVFDPKKIEVNNVNGTIGKSDFKVDGAIMNYIGYVFGENETIKGNVNFTSNFLDLNEFMVDSEETTSDTTSTGIIPIPGNIDFVLKAVVNRANLMDYKITNASGDVVIKNAAADLSGFRFTMLGGQFVVNGKYDTKDLNHPKYDFGLKVENLSMRQAANSSSLVQSYAPIAGFVNGNFNLDFKIGGELYQNMMPNLATVNGGGLVKIVQASLKESKILSGITSATKLADANEVTLKDVMLTTSIKSGRLSVKPFDAKFGDYKTTIAGSTGLDGSIDYKLKMDVPAGKLGTEFNSLVSQYTGGKNDPNSNIPLNITLGRTFTNPSVTLISSEQKEQVKEAVKEVAKEEGTKAVQDIVKGTDAEEAVNEILGKSKTDSTKTDTTSTNNTKQIEDAKDAIKGLLKKKK